MPGSATTLLFRRPYRDVQRRPLRAFLERVAREVAGGREITCLITGDAELKSLNHKFLGKDYATDVLSFPSAEPTGPAGDLAISCARAAAQAKELGHSLDDELRILILHGALHLTGHDHERDAGQMERAEKQWRKRFALPLGLIERARRSA